MRIFGAASQSDGDSVRANKDVCSSVQWGIEPHWTEANRKLWLCFQSK